MIVEKLKKAVGEALKKFGIEAPEVIFEHPADLAHGDYSTNAALVYAKKLKTPSIGQDFVRRLTPRELAEEIVSQGLSLGFAKDSPWLAKVEIAEAGFINFYLSKKFFAESVTEILKEKENFGKNKNLVGKKVMVEYTDPNPFKEFHIGHLMSNAIGESIARLLEAEGAEVKRACWQGDVGLHVAKAVWGLKRFKIYDSRLRRPARSRNAGGSGFGGQVRFKIQDIGQAYAEGTRAYETDEKAKREIEELNRKIFEKSDKEINTLYEAGRKISLEHFEEIYKKLGTKFDYYFFEGGEGREGQPIVEEGLTKGIFEKSERAIVYKGEKQGLHTRVFITSQGFPTYETKELGLNKAKFEKEPDLAQSIIVTANEQSDYFKVVLAAMREVLPEIAEKTKHIAHGLLRFASGKMSSRKGNVITGEGLIEKVKKMVAERIKEREFSDEEKENITEVVAIGAIKYSILRQAIGGDIIFDFEKSISFEGDSGPYLQYSYARAKSVFKKAQELKACRSLTPTKTVGVRLLQRIGILERLLYRFPEIVARAGKEYEPHYIATYLTELASAFNNWYANNQIIGSGEAEPYRLALTAAFATVMKNGLRLLGIKVLEKM